MSGVIQRPISFVALNDVMQPDYRGLIVRRALNFRRQATPAARQRLDAEVGKHIKITVLDEHVAINPATLAALTQACQHDDTLMQAMLSMWQQSQLPLARRMREFLQSKGAEVYEFEQLTSGFLGARPQESMLALVNEFHSRNPSFNTHDVALMLCCVHGYLPGAVAPVASAAPPAIHAAPATYTPPAEDLPDLLAELETLDEAKRTRWHAWLAEMRALPLEAGEWDDTTVRAFALATQRLGQQRQRERQERRARLANILTLLREQASVELDYFGFAAMREWDANAVDLHETAILADATTSLYTELMAHRSGLQQPPAETRAAQLARRAEIERLEERIIAAFVQLDARFRPQAAAPAEPEPIEMTSVIETKSEDLADLAIAIGSPAPLFADHAQLHTVEAHTNGSRRNFFRRK